MIVQELIAIQDRCGYLPEEELRALALRLQVPLHRLHEVASFYPHYKLKPPPKVTVKVCRDMACHILGAPRLRDNLQKTFGGLGPDKVCIEGVSCLGQCDSAPFAVSVNDHVYWKISEQELQTRIQQALAGQPLPHQHGPRDPLGWKIDPYKGAPRYDALRRFLDKRDGDAILKEMETAGLRGMGGAGFPTFRKWSFVRAAEGDEKFVVCNADESEPGTFKDRELMRRTPWLTLEGMILAGLITGAKRGWLYSRHEYHDEMEAFQQAIDKARADKILGDNILGSGLSFDVEIYVSPGGYIQGEESALLEAMEDRRGEPRNKPPYPVTHGLYNKPTVINNVETLAWVPAIVLNGGEWYKKGGVNGASGLRFVSISGDVNKPGVYEVPLGQTVRALMVMVGGMREGQTLKAIATSGPSGGFLPAFISGDQVPARYTEKFPLKNPAGLDILDLPLDFDALGRLNNMLGAAFIVYGSRRNMVEQALNCVQFYRNESCGKCVPCRLGSQKLVDIISNILAGKGDRSLLPVIRDLSQTMSGGSICGLGQVAANPMATVLQYFPDDLNAFLPAALEVAVPDLS